MKILAIPATNHTGGLNHQLVAYAARLLQGRATVEVVDLNDYEMPIYSPAREKKDGVPQPAIELLGRIAEADAVIVSFAEYNGSYTPAWKNTFDWMSRHQGDVYQGKKVAMFAASPGPQAGAGVLGTATASAKFFGAELVGSLGIGTFHNNFDAQAGELVLAEQRAEFAALVHALVVAA